MRRALTLGVVAAASACNLITGIDRLDETSSCATCGADASLDRTVPDTAASHDGREESTIQDAPADESEGLDAAACTPPTPPSLDPCSTIPRLPAPPVIDGKLDCGIPLATMTMQGWTGSVPNVATADLAMGWRPDGLYFYVRVHRPGAGHYPALAGENIFCGDAIEFFVDHNGMYDDPPKYDEAGTRQFIAAGPSDSQASVAVGAIYVNTMEIAAWTSKRFIAVTEPDGFAMEAFFDASDIGLSSWTLAAGAKVGADLQVDLGQPIPDGSASTCGTLLGRFDLQIFPIDGTSCDYPGCNVEEFCTPTLSSP